MRSWSFCDATEVSKSLSFLNETEMVLGYRRLYNFLEVRKCPTHRCRSSELRGMLIDWGEYLGNSTSDFFFKVSTEDSHGTLLVVELTNHARGGVPRHIHYEQDEWFYVVEGGVHP